MDLSRLPIEDGFRLRGGQFTRREPFVDAFAYSLSVLVIFFNELPTSNAGLREAMRRMPTFAAFAVLLALFWSAHGRWSRTRARHPISRQRRYAGVAGNA